MLDHQILTVLEDRPDALSERALSLVRRAIRDTTTQDQAQAKRLSELLELAHARRKAGH